MCCGTDAGAGMIHLAFGDTIPCHTVRLVSVAELLRQYFRIAFLMGKPQDLPGGSTQMRVGLALAATTYLLALIGTESAARIIIHIVLDLGCTALVFQLGLSLIGHPGRFEQAFGGLCGASAFVNLVAIPVYHGRGRGFDPAATAEAPDAGIVAFGEFVLLVWSLSLLAHVLRHTFDLRLAVSILAAFAYVITLVTLLSVLLPPGAAAISDPDDGVSSHEVEESQML